MTPSPWTSLGLYWARAFPELDLRVEFDRAENKPFLQSLEAIVDERKVDVAFPEEPSDLRLVSRSTLEYAAIQTDSQLNDFIANASLRIKDKDGRGMARRGRLNAPPTFKIRIPGRLVRRDPRMASLPSTSADLIEMEYLFAGLDFREQLQFPLGNYNTLEYTMIEGGVSGGRRGELVLRRAPPAGTGVSPSSSQDGKPPSDDKQSSEGKSEAEDGLDPELVELVERAYIVARTLDHRGSRKTAAKLLKTRLNV